MYRINICVYMQVIGDEKVQSLKVCVFLAPELCQIHIFYTHMHLFFLWQTHPKISDHILLNGTEAKILLNAHKHKMFKKVSPDIF